MLMEATRRVDDAPLQIRACRLSARQRVDRAARARDEDGGKERVGIRRSRLVKTHLER